jgi:predicted nucleic acid-binding protein
MDTNHVTAWEARKPTLIAKVEALPTTDLIYTCAITLGEIAAGHEMTSGDQQRRHQVQQFLNIYLLPKVIEISHYTERYYGQIMGRIWKKHSPARASISSDKHLVDLGINMNDVWIVACAWERGLILLTSDSMTVIRGVVTSKEVSFENWLA